MPERRLKILVLSTFDGTNANVFRDFLFSFHLHSRHEYFYVFDCRILDSATDFTAFDVILIFWSVHLLGPDLSEEVRDGIRRAEARKALFLQDEYRDVRPVNRVMAELGINIVFTCAADGEHDVFYPRTLIPSLEATYTVLPGYVPKYLEHVPRDARGPRPLDIAYRSRPSPCYLGDLGREKEIVADRFAALCPEHGLRGDISVRESDRLYGRRWVEFLRASRCVLGSASGASVIDFTGEIRRNCERYLALHPDAAYEDVKARFFADVDWKVVIDTVSPRVFEATALGCALVHHEGGYAGILQADEHYICVKRDYSNIGDVIDRIKDRAFCRRLAERSHADLIASGRLTYRAFAERFDSLLARHVRTRAVPASLSRVRFYGRNYLRHHQAIVPYRGRFLVLPSRGLLHELMRLTLAKLTSGRRGPLSSRLIGNPGEVVSKTRLALGTIWRNAALRLICGQYGRDRRVRSQVRLSQLMNDVVKIDIVRRARAGRLKSREGFRVTIAYDRSSRALTVTSWGLNADGGPEREPAAVGTTDGAPPEVSAALLEGNVSMILWDHSAVSQLVVYCPNDRSRRPRWVTVGLGTGGVYRFEALTRLCQLVPSAVGPAILALLWGAPAVPAPPLASR